MQDSSLIAAALCVAACGMVALLFVVIFYEMPLADAAQVNEATEGAVLRTTGRALNVRSQGNMTRITLGQESTIDVTVFESAPVKKGDCIIVQGRKTSFHHRPQITATRIAQC
jgi:hypothetical protein